MLLFAVAYIMSHDRKLALTSDQMYLHSGLSVWLLFVLIAPASDPKLLVKVCAVVYFTVRNILKETDIIITISILR